MSKQEFLTNLQAGLSGLPQEDVNERLTFYSEMIDDRIEEGLPEEAAVAELGPVDAIVSQVVSEIPLTKIVKNKVSAKRGMRAWEVVLLVISSPIWIPLVIAFFALVLAFYAVIWSVVVGFWGAFVTMAVSSLAFIIASIVLFCMGNGFTGLLILSGALVLFGLTILFFFFTVALTKGAAILTGKIASGIKRMIIGKENKR